MRDGHRIVLVEFQRGRPFSVVTADARGHHDHYDFAWCRRDGKFLWQRSGGSLYLEHGNSRYWAAGDLPKEVRDGGGRKPTGKRLRRLPRRWPLDSLFGRGEETEAVWCRACRDFLPWDEDGDVCGHVRWCRACGQWTGEGHDDPCRCGPPEKERA